MTKLAIVILNWNGLGYLKRFMPYITDHSSGEHIQVWVADNYSADGSLAYLKKHFPEVSLLIFNRNYGFSGGYNRALAAIEAEYYILLNSDVEVTRGWTQPLLKLMENDKGVAACMPKIKNLNSREYFEHAGAAGGFIDFLGYPFCRGRIFNVVERDTGQYDDEREIFWATGACMMVRASDWHSSGGFDEKFFAHMEEIDLCWRLKNAGKKIRVAPSSVVYHLGGGTLPVSNPRKTWFNYRNSLLMLLKNLPPGRLYLLFVRIVLDWLSVIKFIVKFSFADAYAVLRSHISFFILFPEYRGKRKKLFRKGRVIQHKEIYPGSIVLRFFSGRGKFFSQLDL
jgi:GT2 family glycosyltransferase